MQNIERLENKIGKIIKSKNKTIFYVLSEIATTIRSLTRLPRGVLRTYSGIFCYY